MAETPKKSDYKKLEGYGMVYDIYVHKKRNGKPKYVAIAIRDEDWIFNPDKVTTIKGFQVAMSDDRSLIDLKIQLDEHNLGIYGPPYITGYGLGGYPPEETYRGVRIGKFTERDNAEFLPRYTAGLELDGEFVWVDRMTIAEVKKGLDELLDEHKSSSTKE